MRRIAVAVLAVVVAFGLSAGAMAQEGQATKEAPKAKATKLVGQLMKIDGKSLTITVKDGDKSTDTVITCNDATKITQQGEEKKPAPAKFEDLKVGQQVTAFYNAEKVAVGVMIMKAAATAAPAAPAK